MIRIRNLVLPCVLIAAMNVAIRAADQGFTDMEVYLAPQGQEQNGYSPAADAERFRSYARLDKALRLIQAHQLELARQELLPLVEHSPENRRAWSVYLSVLYGLREYVPLIRQADIMLARQPHFIPALLYQSRAFMDTHRLNEAISGFETLERQAELTSPDHLSVIQTLADLYIRAKNYPAALATSTRVLELQTSYQAWFRKGLALDGLDRAEDAEHAYRCSLKLATTQAQRLEALKAIAESLRKVKNWPVAREALLQALEIDPKEIPVLRSLAETEYQLLNYAQAEAHLRQLLLLQPDAHHRELLANILLLRKDRKSAEVEFKALLSEGGEPRRQARAYLALGQIADAMGNPSQSTDYLKRSLAIEPSLSGRETLANLFIKQGALVEADSVLTNLAKELRAPEDKHRVLLTLGQIRMSEKQYSTAAEVFTEAAQIKADAFTLAAASNAEEQAGNLAAAIEFSRRAAAQAPSPQAHLRLGTLQANAGEPEQAVANFETAATQSTAPGEKHAIYEQIGFLHIRSHDYEGARRSFEQALTLGPGDVSLHRSIAEVLMDLGRFADAAAHFKQAVEMDHNSADRRALAVAQEKAGEIDAAVSTYSDLLRMMARPSVDREELCISLAGLEGKRGNHAQAADWWVQASESRTGGRPELLASAAESRILNQQWQPAADLYQRYLTSSHLSSQDRARAFESLGFVSSKVGKDEQAADYLQRAIDTGAARTSAHEDLGFVLYRLGRWRPALDAFLASPASEPNPLHLIAIAHCYEKLGKPGLAIHFLDQALQQPQNLPEADRRQAYADSGFLYAGAHDYRAAIAAWEQAQRLDSTPALALGLARLKRLEGHTAAAQHELDQIHPDRLAQAEQARYFDELAQVYARQGKAEDSRRAWETANQIESSDARNYEIGLAYLNAGRDVEAIPFLERAAKPSGNTVYLQSLAYAYKSAGRPEEAALCFERLAVATPGQVDTYKELAYLQMHLGHNVSAERWFRKAIDAEARPQAGQQTTVGLQRPDENLREDLARLKNRYNATLYEGYSDQPQALATTSGPAPGANNITPAGAGIELDYQPPGIGFRNERILQVFTRALWSNQSGSLAPQSNSGQMGLGVRYKPLISQNLQLSIERLIPLGSDLPHNWMARAMSSWSAGFDLRPTQRQWNYSLLFVDTAFLLQGARTAAEFVQFRQGVTFRFGQVLLITPHGIVTARHQSPQAALGTYLEGGGGLSLRFLLRDSLDLPRKSSFELLMDCHQGALMTQPAATSYHGCRAAGIFRF